MSMTRRQLLLGATMGGHVASPALSAAQAGALTALKPGQVAPAFQVRDSAGMQRTLAEFAGRPVVMEWTSASCPFVRAQYASGAMPTLQHWSRQRNVVWLSVLSTHPKRSDHLAGPKAQAFNLERGALATALLMDEDGAVGRSFGARTTPHMFVIAANGTLAYLGAIDDEASVDAAVVRKSRSYVKAALEELLAGRPVSAPATRPYGCAIGY